MESVTLEGPEVLDPIHRCTHWHSDVISFNSDAMGTLWVAGYRVPSQISSDAKQELMRTWG
jgi:hypothetical protein